MPGIGDIKKSVSQFRNCFSCRLPVVVTMGGSLAALDGADTSARRVRCQCLRGCLVERSCGWSATCELRALATFKMWHGCGGQASKPIYIWRACVGGTHICLRELGEHCLHCAAHCSYASRPPQRCPRIGRFSKRKRCKAVSFVTPKQLVGSANVRLRPVPALQLHGIGCEGGRPRAALDRLDADGAGRNPHAPKLVRHRELN